MLPVCAPAVVGLKVALMVQVEVAATDEQLFVSAKGAEVETVNAAAVV
jgi:hypothetical protein